MEFVYLLSVGLKEESGVNNVLDAALNINNKRPFPHHPFKSSPHTISKPLQCIIYAHLSAISQAIFFLLVFAFDNSLFVQMFDLTVTSDKS